MAVTSVTGLAGSMRRRCMLELVADVVAVVVLVVVEWWIYDRHEGKHA